MSLEFSPTPGTCYNTIAYMEKRCNTCGFREVAKCEYNGWDKKKIMEYYELMKEKGQ